MGWDGSGGTAKPFTDAHGSIPGVASTFKIKQHDGFRTMVRSGAGARTVVG